MSSLSLDEAQQRYVDFLLTVKGRSPGRSHVCKYHLNRLITFLKAAGITQISGVGREHLSAFQEDVEVTDLAKATKKETLRTAVAFFQYLCDYRHLATNPALVVDVPRKGQALPRPILTEEEFSNLLGLAEPTTLMGLRDRCIFQLLYASAMRPEELCRLMIADADLNNLQLLIRRPKNRRDRIVHIDRYTAEEIRRYLERSEAWSGPRAKTAPLFLNANGKVLTRNTLSTYFWVKYSPQFKLRWGKTITFYSLRHTSATDWLDSAARQHRDVLPYVQRQLGHESLESTAIYTHVAIEPLRQMFKQYHPRELQFAKLGKLPDFPDEFQDRWKGQRTPPPPDTPPQG